MRVGELVCYAPIQKRRSVEIGDRSACGAQHGVTVHTLAHSLVKRALIGSGAARKDQVNSMVTQLLGLRRRPEPNDVSDALALALAFGARTAR